MALTYNEIDTVSTKYFDKKIKQQVYDSFDLLKYLRANNKVRIMGGTSLTWPIRYQRLDNADVVDWNDQVNFTAKPTRTAAELEWIPYRSHTFFPWRDTVYNDAGPTRIVNLLEDKANELKDDMVYNLASDIWAASPASGDIAGLADIVDESTTYAGISTTDATSWVGYEDTSTSTMTLLFLFEKIAEATWGEDMPTRHYTTRDLLANYASLLQSGERWVDKAAKDAGTFSLAILDKPVIADPYVPSGDWYGLDMNQFEFWVKEGEDMWVSPWKELFEGGYPKSLGKVMTCVCNLVCRQRRTSFKLTALTGV